MSQKLEDNNIALVRSMSQNFVAGRLDEVKKHVSDTMIMNVPRSLPYGGSHTGWAGYLAVATGIGNHFSEIPPLAEIWDIKGDKVEKITAFYFDPTV